MGTSPAGGGTAGRPAARPRRRGGGPEASSATATIVAVTISDSAAAAGLESSDKVGESLRGEGSRQSDCWRYINGACVGTDSQNYDPYAR